MSIFNQIKAKKPRHNTFDLSHDRKMSMNMGELVPIFCQETVPGDSFSMSTSQMLRFAPMIAPVMHRVNVYTHFFFVPNRIIWANWEKFITGGESGLDSNVMPKTLLSTERILDNGSLGDYFGLPTGVGGIGDVSSLPISAYYKIYDEYYRDQNLIDPMWMPLTDGYNTLKDVDYRNKPLKRAWQHDYFTSALPWTQKGPQATIPIGEDAPIIFEPSGGESSRIRSVNSPWSNFPGTSDLQSADGFMRAGVGATDYVVNDNSEFLKADLSEATSSTINDLRRAFRLQEWLEKNARGGSRYNESILSHFGVRSSDSRLQRPEYLGGGQTPVTISEVLQTSDASAGETPQGNMAGHGISVGKNNSFKYFCEEHGFIMGIMSVMPKTAYQQGIPKQFLKFDKFDYYWPSFAHLGEQPIINKELYVEDGIEDDEVFGYTPRYSEYKYINDSVHGEFRTSLDFWHMGRKFNSMPMLSKEFVEANPTDRIFAVTDAEKLYVHVFHKIKAKRPMPYFGTPTI